MNVAVLHLQFFSFFLSILALIESETNFPQNPQNLNDANFIEKFESKLI
jgi:hypothetical protein